MSAPRPRPRPAPQAPASAISRGLAESLLDLVFGGAPFDPPASLWFGLSLLPANAAGLISEPDRAAGYERVGVRNDPAHFPAAGSAGGVKVNALPIVFNPPAADWGLVKALFVADGPRPGSALLYLAELQDPKRVSAGGPAPMIGAGRLRVLMG